METTFLHYLLGLAIFAVGWFCGAKWDRWQWIHVAHTQDMDMRVDGEYMYRVEYIGHDKKVKV
jgi:hypothetical protein